MIGVPPTLPQISWTDRFDDWTLGQARWAQVGANGGTAPYAWSATGLPDGISFRPALSPDTNLRSFVPTALTLVCAVLFVALFTLGTR